MGRAADRRVAPASRARASCPWPTSRSASPTTTATTACSCTCATPTIAGRRPRRALAELAKAGHPVVTLDVRGRRGPRPDHVLRRVRHRRGRLGARHQPLRPAERAGGQGQHRTRCSSSTGPTASCPACRTPATTALRELLGRPAPPHYVAIMGYVQPSERFDEAVADLRTAIRDATQGHHHVRLRAALPALHRPVPQGRPAGRASSSSSCTTATRTWRSPGAASRSAR